MILARVNDYLRSRKRATLVDLARGLDSTPEALAGMLATLERKGRVRRLAGVPACRKGCCDCDPLTADVYEWIGG